MLACPSVNDFISAKTRTKLIFSHKFFEDLSPSLSGSKVTELIPQKVRNKGRKLTFGLELA